MLINIDHIFTCRSLIDFSSVVSLLTAKHGKIDQVSFLNCRVVLANQLISGIKDAGPLVPKLDVYLKRQLLVIDASGPKL